MHKKIFKTLSLITIILIPLANCSSFDDDQGRPAPTSVRLAAEKVYGEFNRLQELRYFGVDTGVKEPPVCCCFGGVHNVYIICNRVDPQDVRLVRTSERPYDIISGVAGEGYKAARGECRANISTAMTQLRLVTNEEVNSPKNYADEQDMHLSWSLWTDGYYKLDADLKDVVKKFVKNCKVIFK